MMLTPTYIRSAGRSFWVDFAIRRAIISMSWLGKVTCYLC